MKWSRWGLDTTSGSQSYLEIPRSPFDISVKDVCKPCNEGWLSSKVEVPVQRTLVSLSKGHHETVDSANIKNLALWAAKTSATRALQEQGDRMMPPHHYRWIMDTLEPPPATKIWATPCQSSSTITRHQRFKIAYHSNHVTGHVTTLIIGNLVLFTVGFSEEIDLIQSKQLDSHVLGQTNGASHLLWPDPSPMEWPRHSSITSMQAKELGDTTQEIINVASSFPRF